MLPNKPFSLLRWFAWLSPIAIGLSAMVNAWLISSFLSSHLFQREAEVTRDFVQNILYSDGSLGYLSAPDDSRLQQRFANTIEHLTNMRDVLRTNVYGVDRRVIWSTDAKLVGQQFASNDELDEALAGNLVVHAGDIASSDNKDEHVGLNPSIRFFVESYIPIVQHGDTRVMGVVEIYKAPLALTQAIHEGRQQVGIAASFTALALYVCLFWLIRRADGIIKAQRTQLLEAETLAVVGELTSSVAHNIRNPLSSIRSAAELVQAFPQENATEQATDIIREVDRISQRVTELLRLSGRDTLRPEPIELQALLKECFDDHQASFVSRGLRLYLEEPLGTVRVMVDRVLILQVFHSLLSNAVEAMASGGECRMRVVDSDEKLVTVEICDTGCGIDEATMGQVFRPFFTTKPKGLGLGLPLARRIVERFGGGLSLESQCGRGTIVYLRFSKV